MRIPPLRFLLAPFLLAAAVLAAAPRFAHEASDLKPDPAARFGQLENGMRYVVYPNHEPKGRASLRLLVLAGSLQEQEDQRGVAHFLEHMAFNGSINYAPGTLVEFFQRMGMSFGGDTNASTGFDRTLYLLELPETSEKALSEGLKVFGDYASGLLLSSKEIDQERGIILSEKRTRDNVGFRTLMAQFEFMFADTLLPKRMPIGTEAVIKSAPRERFVEFWDRWYRPEKMAAIIVGDVDPALAERLIREAFSGLKARGPVPAAPDRGTITRFEGIRAAFHAEPEATATSVSITTVKPYQQEPDTAAYQLARLPRSLALNMLNRRLSVLAKKENAAFSSARVTAGESFGFLQEASVSLNCQPAQWSAALAVGEQELRRALEHGFQPGELAEVVAVFRNGLDRAVKGAATRRSSAIAGEIADTLLNDRVLTSAADDLALFGPALDKVTPQACLGALRAAFAGNGRYVMVSGNLKLEGDPVAAITRAHEASRAVAVAAPAAEAAATWAYPDFGAPGRVTSRQEIADLGITLVSFANGVRLNLKRTDFEAGRIRVLARVGSGAMTEPRDQRGLATLAGATFSAGGLGRHSTDDLRRLLAGRNAGAGFRVATDAFELVYPAGMGGRGGGDGGTTREDLLLTLQLFAATLTDPGYRPESLRLAQRGLEQMYTGFEHTPNGPLSTEVASLIAGGDPRFGMPGRDVMMGRRLEEVRAWLTPHLTKGPIEVALVGDLDVEASIGAVARTLGALPARDPRPAHDDLRKVAFPDRPFTRTYTIASEIPKGVVVLYWPTHDAFEAPRSRRLSMLATVFSDRLRVKIREEMAGTYSPRAGSFGSDTFPGYGYITTSIDVAPDMADQVAEAALALADDMARNGVKEEELNRARLPVLTSTRESQRTNAYWLGSVLARAQEKPEVLEWSRTRLSDLEKITAAELSALARQYLGRDRASRATVLPTAKSP